MEFTNAARQSFELNVTVDGAPPDVFPLLCPVREYDWIPRWEGELIYSESGVAELGCVFRTRHPKGEEIWTVSRYEPPTGIGFVRVLPNVWTVLMDLDLSPAAGATTLRVRHTFTALGPEGDTAIAQQHREGHADQWRSLAALASHYLRTGTMLSPPETATSPTTSS